MNYLSYIDHLVVILYLIIVLLVGLYQSKKTVNVREFSIAARNYSTPILIATIFATWIGGESSIGLAEKVFNFGIVYMVIFLGSPINKLIIAWLIAPRMGQFNGMISPGEIIGKLYGQKAQIVTGLVGAIKCSIIVGAQVCTMGYLFEYFLSMQYEYGVIIGAAIITFYSAFGGIRAVTITDVIQFITLIIAVPMICNIGLSKVGGYAALFDTTPTKYLSLDTGLEGKKYEWVFLLLAFAIPFLNPAMIQRLLMARDTKQMSTSMLVSAAIEVPFFISVGCIGLIALHIAPALQPENAFLYLVDTLLPIGLKGLAVAGLLAIIMSTADSFLNIGSILAIHDLLKPIKKQLSQKQELFYSVFATFAIGIFSIFIAITYRNVVDIIITSLSFWTPIIVVPLYAGIFGVRTVPATFFNSAIAGFITFVFWRLFNLENVVGFGGLIPSLFANMLCFFLSYLFFKARDGRKEAFKNFFNPITTKMKNLAQLLSYFTFGNLFQKVHYFCDEKVSQNGAPYILFGLFTLFNYMFPYFLWAITSSEQQSLIIILRLIGIIGCLIFIFHENLPTKLKKHLPVYWYLNLTYNLPFLTTFLLLNNQISHLWLLNCSLAFLLLAVIVDWFSFLLITALGISASYILFILTIGIAVHIHYDFLIMIIYALFIVVVVELFFARKRESMHTEKINNMLFLGGAIAHEIKSPLSAANMYAATLKTALSKAIVSMPVKKGKRMFRLELDELDYGVIHQMGQKLYESTSVGIKTVDQLLVSLKSTLIADDMDVYDIKNCVEEAVVEYLCEGSDNKQIIIEEGDRFNFYGSKHYIKLVIINLIKNSFYHNGIKTRVKILFRNNKLCIKDNGRGITEEDLQHIFDKFYTKNKTGTGIGLAFCKMVMEDLGGDIECKSELGKYTEFILTFPKYYQ